jgi:ABC-type phosphonate transport system ATPase subunit
VDIAHSEAREPDAELARMIERHSRKGEVDSDEREEIWKESVRRYNARRRQELRSEWHVHHVGQAERLRRTLEMLIAFHEAEAERYLAKGA